MTLCKRFVALTAISCLLLCAAKLSSARPGSSRDAARTNDGPKPLVDVEQLMEHVVNPGFLAAKECLREKPADAKSWKAVQSASIILGESGNLLLFRKPADADMNEWTALSVELRDAGDRLIKAARAKDFDAAKTAYRAVVASCNKCHERFGDDGEPKIEP